MHIQLPLPLLLLSLPTLISSATIKITIDSLQESPEPQINVVNDDTHLPAHGLQWPIYIETATTAPTCPKDKESFELDCGKGIKTTKDCAKWCQCVDGQLKCPETEDCGAESIDYMCGEISECVCEK